MEAISNEDGTSPPAEATLYDRRVTDQRPKHLCPRCSNIYKINNCVFFVLTFWV